MTALIALLLAATQAPQAIRLESGDYRWIPFTVKHVPTEVECRYEVLQGGASVHVELLPMSEFRAFNRGRAHETLAVSPNSRSGAFRRVIEQRGQYAVVVKNERNAPPVTVSLEVRTDLNPDAGLPAQELPPRRRLTVILISFALFFIIVTYSGVKLVRTLKTP
ncbi:MAG: hypothetical protein ABUS51_03790 [Acidobacteriota bacterium]